MKTIRQSGVQAIAWVALSVLAPFASLAALISGDASEVASNVVHVNGNVYDQFLLTGVSATMTADPGQITRVSFLDIDEDILQVEFSGSGTLTVTLESATGPALAAKYHQPGVLYMRGHARIRISGSDASTNVSVFSVGASNALNQSIIKPGEVYDGVADLAELEIVPDPEVPFGSVFGGIRAGNASFWAQAGRVGIYAPRVHVQTVVRIADMQAFDTHPRPWSLGSIRNSERLKCPRGGRLCSRTDG